jgi:NADH dehydrogenase FAD-containing subunit
MSIQFAISEGKCAAENVERALQGNSLKAFKPFDPGYLIPMANNRACGIVLGKSVYGRTAIALHYFMCTFRSVGLSNQWHIATSSLSSLIRGKR